MVLVGLALSGPAKAGSHEDAGHHGNSAVIVRTFNNFRVPAEQLQAAQVHAATILKVAGIEVQWARCWEGNAEAPDASDRCRTPIGSDIVLRLHRTPAGNGHPYVSLGFALVVSEGLPFLATVYADRADGIARRARVDPAIVLGRAIAHEIGHLLLNSNSHPEAGLMRAAWSQRELRGNAATDWRFLEPEIQAVRDAAQRRIDSSRLTIPIE
jgi:hypothetical protein